MLTPSQKQYVLDATISIGFGFFLIFHTSFNTVSLPWFLVLCGFNVVMQLYRKGSLIIKQEADLEEDDD